jgi:hypothetical protein
MRSGGTQRWMNRLSCLGLLGALNTAGCSTTAERAAPPRPVSLAAFARSAPEAPTEAPTAAKSAAPAPRPAAPGTRLGAGSPPTTGQETDEPPMAGHLQVGERVIVDSMVGQVNGRPIFADEFFLPIEDQLIALSQRANERQFMVEAADIVTEELREVVLNALFLAEAEASLTPEEKIGIRYWFANVAEQVKARSGGSEAEARKRAMLEGTTFEDKLENIKNRELISKLLEEKIYPRVIVSWRDVEREYRRRYEEFNPPAAATLARIRLTTADQAGEIEQVARRLAAGDDFLEVAGSVGQPERGIWQTFKMGAEGLREPQFADEAAQAQVARLREEGDTTEPFELGRSTWWLHVAEIDQPPGHSLYDPDVQRILADHLRMTRGTEEQDRYIASLLEKGIYDELEAMAQRLVAIAVLRYGP